MHERSGSYVLVFREVGKIYPLYPSPGVMALDRMGFVNRLPKFLRPTIRHHHALKSVSLSIRRGERVGIVGRNGAGKTTLLKLVTGNFAPSTGELIINGAIHSLMQTGFGFVPDFTGKQNINSALKYSSIPEDGIAAATDDIVEFCELGEHLDQPLRTYSAGMAARLQFATATAMRPDILLIDEVLGAGDSYFMMKSARRMRQLASSGCTLLLVSHAVQQILQFCDRAIWLEEGEIVMDGPALEVTNAYTVFLERRYLSYRLEAATGQSLTRNVGQSPIDSMKTTLDDGREVFRLPGNPGLKISTFDVTGPQKRRGAIFTGDSLEVEFTLLAETSGRFVCRYLITLWTSLGFRMMRFENDIDAFELEKGGTRTIKAIMDPMILCRGKYFASFSIYEVSLDGSTAHGENIRHDVLIHACEIEIREIEPNPFPFEATISGQWNTLPMQKIIGVDRHESSKKLWEICRDSTD